MKTLDENAVGGQWKWGYSNTIFSSRIYIYIPIQKHTETIADWTIFCKTLFYNSLYLLSTKSRCLSKVKKQYTKE